MDSWKPGSQSSYIINQSCSHVQPHGDDGRGSGDVNMYVHNVYIYIYVHKPRFACVYVYKPRFNEMIRRHLGTGGRQSKKKAMSACVVSKPSGEKRIKKKRPLFPACGQSPVRSQQRRCQKAPPFESTLLWNSRKAHVFHAPAMSTKHWRYRSTAFLATICLNANHIQC